jgi:hypothetical protein
MARQTKINRGFYPISYADIRRMIGYCNTWGYGNKDTCKYVAENSIEQIQLNHPDKKINDQLYSNLISIAHDINNGARFKGQELLIPIEL